MNNQTKKNKKLRVLLTVVASVLALVLLVSGGVTIYANSLLNRIQRPDDSVDNTLSADQVQEILNSGGDGAGGAVHAPDDETETQPDLITDVEDAVNTGENIINVLLIGSDWREGQSWELSDTMILCTINKEAKSVTLTSFMRDMYVKLPDYNGMVCGHNRINCCYALGGMGMLDQCLLENFGVAVDHNVTVKFQDFASIVDLLGGVDIELTGIEASHLNKNNIWALTKGMNHLDGEQALAYSRIRKLDSDFYRTNRQRTVLTAMIDSVRDMNLAQLNTLAQEVIPLVTTDMTNDEILKYIVELAPLLPELTVNSLRIPADGAYYGANKGTEEAPMDVLIPDLEKNRDLLREVLGDTMVEE